MIEDQNFYDALVAKFPDTATTGQVSRSEIADTMKTLGTSKWPTWLMANKVGRGLYSIAGGNTVPKDEASGYAVEQVVNNTTYDYVPARDENYVPFGNYRDIETIVKSQQFYPAYVSGPTGNGKSTTIEQACAKYKRSMIRVNLNMMTDEDQLIGSKTLEDGNVKIVDGPVIIAMKMGIPILLDEVDAGAANTLLCLQPILEGKPYYYKLRNEIVYPTPGFNIFATANTKGKGSEDGRYIGTNILNEAFLERFAVTFNQEYPSANVERKIVLNLMKSYECEDEDFADTLVKWADAIRRTFADGGVDETITTRRLVHIVRAFSIFKDKKKAVELCTNRFDEITRLAFLDLFEKVSVPVAAPVSIKQEDIEIPF
jgi:MoxR-like ATPase